MRLIWVVAYDDVCWLEVTMDVALRVDALQPIHKLQSYNDDSLYLEFAFLERFFEFLKVNAEQLHD